MRTRPRAPAGIQLQGLSGLEKFTFDPQVRIRNAFSEARRPPAKIGRRRRAVCGRYSLSVPTDVLAKVFRLASMPALKPRFNIAPTQQAPVVRISQEGERRLDLLKWGLIPAWADDPSIGNRLINARAESAAEKPAFRTAFRCRRCLIPADGFYEWLKSGKAKQPFLIRLRQGQPFAFAGLWECWRDKDGQHVESFTILTTQPNSVAGKIHNRMPAIVDPAHYEAWLDPKQQDPEALRSMLKPYHAEQMESFPVSSQINNPKNCIDRPPSPAAREDLFDREGDSI